MWWKNAGQKAKEAARKDTLDKALESQKGLEAAAKSTMGLASDVAGTLQAKIDEYADQLDMTARLLSDALLMVDNKGVITSYNNAAKGMLGWDKKEVVGQPLTKLFDLGDPAPAMDQDWMIDFCKRVNEDTLDCGSVYYEDFKAVTKDGARLYVDVSGSMLTRNNSTMYFIILVRDVTNRVANAKMIDELALKNNELITAINASDSGIVILEPDDSNFKTVFVNKGIEKMTGMERSELLAARILDLIADDGGQFEVRRNLTSHITGRSSIKVLQKDGGEVHAEVTITPVLRGSKLAEWVLVFYDTTELVKATEELKRSESHFRAFAETSTEVLIVHDSERILDWNSRLRKMTGYTDNEIAKLSPYDLVHPLERNNIRAKVGEDGISQYETLNVTKSGDVIWVAVSSQPIEWDGCPGRIAVMRDITPYRTVENQLSTMRERYQSVVDNTIDLVCCFDKNFKVTFTNQTFRDYFQLDVEDLEGFSLLDVIPEADHLKFIDYMHSITDDTNVRRALHRVQRGDELRWQDWIDKGIFDDSGELIEYQSVCRDVTHLFPQK
jgi:PAS domain S-box-containing protein